MEFTYEGNGNPETDFIAEIHGPDGYVSCQFVLDVLNLLEKHNCFPIYPKVNGELVLMCNGRRVVK